MPNPHAPTFDSGKHLLDFTALPNGTRRVLVTVALKTQGRPREGHDASTSVSVRVDCEAVDGSMQHVGTMRMGGELWRRLVGRALYVHCKARGFAYEVREVAYSNRTHESAGPDE